MADAAETDTVEVEVDEEKDIEDEVKELQENLNKLKKESAGKDAKISKLLKEMERQAEESKRKPKKEKDYTSMEPDDLRREIERVRDEVWEEAEKEIAKERSKTADQNFKLNILNTVTKIDNLEPSLAAELVKLMTVDKNADEDELQGVMQSFTNKYNNVMNKHKVILDNRNRTNYRPSSGEVDITKVPSERTWSKWTPQQRQEWARSATPEQLDKIQYRT